MSDSERRPNIETKTVPNGQVLATLPQPVRAYLRATNQCDLDALLATFADDALVNDQLTDYWGSEAIGIWAARDIINERFNLKIIKAVQHYGHSIITAHAEGLFDKRGLPNPLVLTLYFSFYGDRIVQLIILRNHSGI